MFNNGFRFIDFFFRSVILLFLLSTIHFPGIASLPQSDGALNQPVAKNLRDDSLWELTPIVTQGMPVLGNPSRKIGEIGRIYPIDKDTLLFQAVLVGENKLESEALIEYKTGNLTIFASGESSVTNQIDFTLSAIICILPSQFLTPNGLRIINIAGMENKVYLTVEEPILPGSPKSVYSWSKSGISKIFGRGNTIKFSNNEFTIKEANLYSKMDFPSKLRRIIHFTTTKGTTGIAILDAKGIRPVLIQGEPIPGRPETILKYFSDDFMNSVMLNDIGEVVVYAQLIGKDKKKVKGLFAFSETSTREIAIKGDPLPGGGNKDTIGDPTLIALGPQGTFLVDFGVWKSKFYIGKPGSWKKITRLGINEEEASALNPIFSNLKSKIIFIPGDSQTFIYRTWDETETQYKTHRTGQIVSSILVAGGYYDGNQVRPLAWCNSIPTFEMTQPGGIYSGVFLEYQYRKNENPPLPDSRWAWVVGRNPPGLSESFRTGNFFMGSKPKPVDETSSFESIISKGGELKIPPNLPLVEIPILKGAGKKIDHSKVVTWFSEHEGLIIEPPQRLYSGGLKGEHLLWLDRISSQFIKYKSFNTTRTLYRVNRNTVTTR